MKSHRSILTLVLWIVTSLAAFCQDVIVSVTPVQQVLPPQVLPYVDNPGKFFEVALTNTTDEEQLVYLGMQIEQVNPSAGLAISTPPKRQPQRPLRLAPKQTLNMTSLEIKNLFKHIPSNEISCPAGLFDDYQNGSFALLPEGQYEAHLTAYRWRDPQYATPLVVSNPTGGMCYFTVCYKAQAPTFILPNPLMAEIEVPMMNPIATLFQWTEPTLTCAPSAQSYRYDFRVVELLPGQHASDAMDHNPTVYLSRNNATPQVLIPSLYVQRDFKVGRTYLAQVTAQPATSFPLSYVMLENEGKSGYIRFQIAPPGPLPPPSPEGEGAKDAPEGNGEQPPSPNDDGDEAAKGDADGGTGISIDDVLDVIPNVDVPIDLDFSISDIIDVGDEIDLDDIIAIMGGVSGSAELVDAPPYRFRNPKIDKPTFINENIHRQYIETDIELEWTRPWFLGGEGPNPEDIRFEYNVQVFNGGSIVSSELATTSKPIFEKKTNELALTIKWDDIKTKVQVGDEVYLRIEPLPSVDAKDIRFEEDVNMLGLTICKPTVRDVFECSSLVSISNRKPTTLSVSELKGRKVKMGEFEMELGNDLTADSRKAGTLTGHAVIKWMPGGFATNVHVRVDTLSINTDFVVFGGEAHTYGKDQKTVQQTEGVDKLFSDWGLDNLTGAGGSYSYAKTTQLDANDPENAINVNIDVEGYFNAFHNMSAAEKKAASLLGKANMNDFYCPAHLPDYLNEGPLDMQIASMTFTPYYATMNIVGELQIEEKANRNNILMFGAPRLCFGPSSLIPEAGTIALLADYGNIRDPKTGYICRFKAPKNLDEPTDGCYMAWKDYTFRELGIDVDMKLPKLKKVEGGKVTAKKPILNIKTTINSWDSWIASATLDAFEVDGLSGWTFEAKDIVLDHSKTVNNTNMAAFPQGYDKAAAGLQGQNPEYWQGLFIKTVAVKLPKSLQIGSGRMSLNFSDMFIDCSGLTMKGGISNAFKGKTGSLGGWAFNLEEVGLSFIQSNFNNCYFNGDVQLPLLTDDSGKKAKIDYRCEIRRRLVAGKQNDGTAFLFTVQAANEQNLNLDLFLATVQLNKATTYLAMEATEGSADASANKTYVEFCMGGIIEIGGKKSLERSAKKLSVDLHLPDVHFTGFRIANCNDKDWTSSYAEINKLREARQAVHLNESASYLYYGGKTIHSSDGSFWFSTGEWSLASIEKDLGPFKFKLEKYGMDISLQNNATKGSYAQVKLNLGGSVSLVKGFSLTAAASVDVLAGIYNISSITDITTDFEDVVLKSCEVDCTVAGMGFVGSMATVENVNWGKGFSASLKVSLPGDLFTLETSGGYYKHSGSWNWGYLTVEAEAAVGVPVPPIEFRGFSGGFYFNCSRSALSPSDVTPKDGVIGAALGVTIASMGSDALFNGKLNLNVAYDTKHSHFSQFLFTGDLEAVDGLISSKVTLLYENNELDKFFQLNITTDPAASNLEGAQAVNPAAASPATKSDVTHNFDNIEDAENETTEGNHSSEKLQTCKASSRTAGLAQPSLQIDLKITFKENGKNLSRRKWHLYLGEPDESKRIGLTLIDLNAYIVELKIGANMYVCIGNELPGDGALPPIPTTISNFLNGSTQGAGVQSDNASKADASRAMAMSNFGGSISGGVMFGAQVYGHLGVNLGILSGSMDMLAGFDVSLRKLSASAYCMNLGKTPGWHQWYGEGQLYAYLMAAIDLGVDLGFISAKINLIKAEMGGVLQMGGPAPSYFIGKLRAKVNLLHGLVKFNKKFEFECGQVCHLFRGNPLDNFVLFDNFTVGDTLQSVGWDDKNRIAPFITQSPRITANATLGEHFRALDENELQKVLDGYNASEAEREELEMQAQRTFIFHADPSTIKLMQYANKDAKSPEVTYTLLASSYKGDFIPLDINFLNSYLKANKYYKLEVGGYAKELIEGFEVLPYKFDEKKKKYIQEDWTQTACYYFATGPSNDVEDQADLQKYVALAYPSLYNELSDGVKDDDVEHYRLAYYNDVVAPTIALKRNIKDNAFKKGRLQWRVLTPRGIELHASDAAWVSTRNTLNLEPQRKLQGVQSGKDYILSLDYLMLVGNAVDTINIGRQHVHVLNESANWRSGTVIGDRYNQSLDYEKPFVASVLNSYERNTYSARSVSDYDIATGRINLGSRGESKYLFNYDPSYYVSYLSNWLCIGGHKIESNYFRGLYVTDTQSAVFTLPNTDLYEGKFLASQNRIYNEASVIADRIFYTSSQMEANYGLCPLPTLDDPTYDYVGITNPRVYAYDPNRTKVSHGYNIVNEIKRIYEDVEAFQTKMKERYQALLNMSGRYSNKDAQLRYLNTYTGTFIESPRGILQVPYYQLMLLCSPMYIADNRSLTSIINKAYLGPRGYRESQICGMLSVGKDGRSYASWDGHIAKEDSLYRPTSFDGDQKMSASDALKKVKTMTFLSYRVNTFDFTQGRYSINLKLLNGECAYTSTITNPYDSSPTYSEGNSLTQYDAPTNYSTGTVVGGTTWNRDSSGMDYALTAMREALRGIIEQDEVVTEKAEKDDKLYKDAKAAYDEGMKHVVTCYNSGLSYNDDFYDDQDKINCILETTEYNKKMVKSLASTLVENINTITQEAEKGSAIVRDAEAIYNSYLATNAHLNELFEQIDQQVADIGRMYGEYMEANEMLTDECRAKAKEIWDASTGVNVLITNRLREGGKLMTTVDNINRVIQKANDLNKQIPKAYPEDDTAKKSYEHKKQLYDEVATACSDARFYVNQNNEDVDYVVAHRNDMADFMAEMAKVAPKGSASYKNMLNRANNIETLYAERESYISMSEISFNDLEDIRTLHADYIDKLYLKAQLEPYYLAMEGIYNSAIQLEKTLGLGKTVGSIDIENVVLDVEKSLGKCFEEVEKSSSHTITNTSASYKTYRNSMSAVTQLRSNLKQSIVSEKVMADSLSKWNPRFIKNYDYYAGKQTDKNGLAEVDAMKKKMDALSNQYKGKNDTQYYENEYKEEWAEAVRWNRLYSTPNSIVVQYNNLVQFREELAKRKTSAESWLNAIKTSTKDQTASFKSIDGLYSSLEAGCNKIGTVELYYPITVLDELTFKANGVTYNENLMNFWYQRWWTSCQQYKQKYGSVKDPKEKDLIENISKRSQAQIDSLFNIVPYNAPIRKSLSANQDAIDKVMYNMLVSIPSFMNETVERYAENSRNRFSDFVTAEAQTRKKNAEGLKEIYDDAKKVEELLIATEETINENFYGSGGGTSMETRVSNLTKSKNAFDERDNSYKLAYSKLRSSSLKLMEEFVGSIKVSEDKAWISCLDDELRYIDEINGIMKKDSIVAGLWAEVKYQDSRTGEIYTNAMKQIAGYFMYVDQEKADELLAMPDEEYRRIIRLSAKAEDYLAKCFNKNIKPNGYGVMWSYDQDYKDFRSWSDISKPEKCYKKLDELRKICDKFPEYRKKLNENYQHYTMVEMFDDRLKIYRDTIDYANRVMDTIEARLHEAEIHLAECEAVRDRMMKFREYYSDLNYFTDVVARVQHLCYNLPQIVSSFNMEASRFPVVDKTETVKAVDWAIQEFGTRMNQIEAGERSITDKFGFFNHGSASSVKINIMELLRDYLVPLANKAGEEASVSKYLKPGSLTETIDFYNVQKGYYDEVNGKIPDGVTAWTEAQQNMVAFEEAYNSLIQKVDQKTYFAKKSDSYEARFLTYVKNKVQTLKQQMSGFDAVYAYALETEQALLPHKEAYEKLYPVLQQHIESEEEFSGDVRNELANVWYNHHYEASHLPVRLGNRLSYYEPTVNELKQFCSSLSSYGYESYEDEVKDLIDKYDKANEVYETGINLEKAIIEFDESLGKLITDHGW